MKHQTQANVDHVLRMYFHAKDENRPHLMAQVFAPDARLEMVVKSEAISFPAVSHGLPAIAGVLSGKFGQLYENVYTFCLQRPQPDLAAGSYSCDWLVGMSDKESGKARVGCGRYDWQFQSAAPFLAKELRITIEAMQVLPSEQLPAVLDWLTALPYLWTRHEDLLATAPTLAGLQPVLDYLARGIAAEQ